MRQIYSSAHTVWIWLGEENCDSNVAFRFLERRSALSSETISSGGLWKTRQYNAVLNLCNRKYWQRIWIVQEIMLAKEATIMCGVRNIAWSKLQQLIEALQAISDRSRPTHISGASDVLASKAANIVRAKSNWDGKQTLTTLIAVYRDQEATNVRDMVYGLHGLASDIYSLFVDHQIDEKGLRVKLLHHTVPLDTPGIKIMGMKKEISRFAQMMNIILKIGLTRDYVSTFVTATINPLDGNVQESEERNPAFCPVQITEKSEDMFRTWECGYNSRDHPDMDLRQQSHNAE